ncbi:MAG: class E sortase [bacterium]|nr:class E sortase [bacterium]
MCLVAHAQLPSSDALQKSGEVLGKLSIPSIKLKQIVREGVDISIIDLGVAHWVGSPLPGEKGNVVLGGHRSTKTAPFYKIENVKVGDKIMFTSKDRIVTEYSVYEMFIIIPTEMYVVYPPTDPADSIMTIFSCHPIGSKAKRFVVRARLNSQ